MSDEALDLLLRVAAQQLREASCQRCAASLEGAEIRPVGKSAEAVVLEVVCPSCGHVRSMEIKPEGS